MNKCEKDKLVNKYITHLILQQNEPFEVRIYHLQEEYQMSVIISDKMGRETRNWARSEGVKRMMEQRVK